MTKAQNSGEGLLSRRQAIGRVAGASLGIVSALRAAEGADLASAGLQTRLGNPPYPSWNTEMRQHAPNVYAYTQAGGPGVPSSAISNGACIVGADHYLAIDAFAAPPHTKAYLAAASKVAADQHTSPRRPHHRQLLLPAGGDCGARVLPPGGDQGRHLQPEWEARVVESGGERAEAGASGDHLR